MKRLIVLFALLLFFSPSVFSEEAYLWDVPIGSSFSVARSSLESVLGKPLHFEGKGEYTASNLIIKGLPFELIVNEGDDSLFAGLTIRNEKDLPLSPEALANSDLLVFSQYNAILSMLIDKFDAPLYSNWYFGSDYPLFDSPVDENGFDFHTIMLAASERSCAVRLYWDNVYMSLSVHPRYNNETRVILGVSEPFYPQTPYPETFGPYSKEALLLNSGISSF